MNDRRISRQFGRWPGLAVARDRAVDQFRIEIAQAGVVQLQAPHHAGAEILDQNIGGRDQSANDLDPVGRFQIEHQALLADIELAERSAAIVAHRRPRAHRLAFGGFDLDDLRAQVGQHPRAMRSGDRGREIEHAKAVVAPCQITLIVIAYGHKAPRLRGSLVSSAGATLDGAARTGKTAVRNEPANTAHFIQRKLDPFLHSPCQGWNEDTF